LFLDGRCAGIPARNSYDAARSAANEMMLGTHAGTWKLNSGAENPELARGAYLEISFPIGTDSCRQPQTWAQGIHNPGSLLFHRPIIPSSLLFASDICVTHAIIPFALTVVTDLQAGASTSPVIFALRICSTY
jgi:hypothetical protein